MSSLPQSATMPGSAQLEQTNLAFKRLSYAEAVAYLVGTNVGAAILSLPYAARLGGFPAVVIVGVLSTLFAMISHLLIAETMLRTPKVTQLMGIFRTYVFRGTRGGWFLGFMFVVTIGVAIPALTAYVQGGAEALQVLFGLDHRVAVALFFVPGIAVVWLGLRAIGYVQKLFSLVLGCALIFLAAGSLVHPGFSFGRLLSFHASGLLPIIPVGVFTCMSQTSVPEIVRGLADRPRLIPRAIRTALLINLGFVLVVPMSIFGILSASEISPLATASWGLTLGKAGSMAANLFAFLALITSFWGTAGSILTNVVDIFRFPSDWDLRYRLVAFAITVAPSLVLIALNLAGFVELIQVAGGVGGVLLALLPIVAWKRARRQCARTPEYSIPDWLSGWIQWPMIVFYLGTLAVAAIFV